MKRMLAVLTGMALLSACTVVDLDADGKPILPKDPHAKPSYTTQTPQQMLFAVVITRGCQVSSAICCGVWVV